MTPVQADPQSNADRPHRFTPAAVQPEIELPPDLALAFAPLHKGAFGIAIGVATGLALSALTVINILRGRVVESPLWLLSQYFHGYTVSWLGALIALAWGCVLGFVMGWFIAFCRNIALVVSIFVIRTRAELTATRDFMDHI